MYFDLQEPSATIVRLVSLVRSAYAKYAFLTNNVEENAGDVLTTTILTSVLFDAGHV